MRTAPPRSSAVPVPVPPSSTPMAVPLPPPAAAPVAAPLPLPRGRQLWLHYRHRRFPWLCRHCRPTTQDTPCPISCDLLLLRSHLSSPCPISLFCHFLA